MPEFGPPAALHQCLTGFAWDSLPADYGEKDDGRDENQGQNTARRLFAEGGSSVFDLRSLTLTCDERLKRLQNVDKGRSLRSRHPLNNRSSACAIACASSLSTTRLAMAEITSRALVACLYAQ